MALRKSGRRNTKASDYGMYAIADAASKRLVAGHVSGRFDFTLDDVEKYLETITAQSGDGSRA